MGFDRQCNTVLELDNYSAHAAAETLTTNNFSVLYLPAIGAALHCTVQPQYQDILRALNVPISHGVLALSSRFKSRQNCRSD
jgi:hypothetical protein